MPSETGSSSSATPVWSTGLEQIEVEIVVTGEMYNIDVDIAKRMGIIQGKSIASHSRIYGKDSSLNLPLDSQVVAAGTLNAQALTFCANDRSCSEPPSKELAHIIKETAPPDVVPPSVSPEPKPAPEASTSTVEQGFTHITLADDDEDDEEDGSYSPSESEASDSGEEYSDTDLADVGTANIKAERDEYNAREKEKRLLGL